MLPFRFFLPITASDFASSLFSTKINFNFLAVRTGLEPATPGVTGRYSNQLNYRTIVQTFEPMEGIEPTTPRLQITCSGQLSYIGERGCKDITFSEITSTCKKKKNDSKQSNSLSLVDKVCEILKQTSGKIEHRKTQSLIDRKINHKNTG